MKLSRMLAVFFARNKEFYRDRASLGWTFLFPFFIILGFAFAFNEDSQEFAKVGWVNEPNPELALTKNVTYETLEEAKEALRKQKLDLVVDSASSRYWIAKDSPKGELAESLLINKTVEAKDLKLEKQTLEGQNISYVEWLIPGIMGMNIMFIGIFGIGFVIVRYRKNGVLRRLKATPLTAPEFLSAQIASRLVIIVISTLILYLGCKLVIPFENRGSNATLLLVLILGATSMISIGMLTAARTKSEELASGLLNFFSWPMMIFSEVWFSSEGTQEWMQTAINFLPLTHLNRAARLVMNEGAGIADISFELTVLAVLSVVFVSIGSMSFKWE